MQHIATEAQRVLDFWFGELTPQQHFAKDDAMDDNIRRHFGDLQAELLSGHAEGWRDTPEHILAAIIVLDQFSRNLFRGQAAAFAADPLSVELTLTAIERGWHRHFEPAKRAFLYMPLMHCEDMGVQLFSLRCFADEGLENNLAFARDHAAVIEEFGRYPSRNAALGRVSTEAELAYLAQPDVGW